MCLMQQQDIEKIIKKIATDTANINGKIGDKALSDNFEPTVAYILPPK